MVAEDVLSPSLLLENFMPNHQERAESAAMMSPKQEGV